MANKAVENPTGGEVASGDDSVTSRPSKTGLGEQFWGSTEWIRGVIDSAVDGIIVIDTCGRIGYMNPSALRMFGWTRDECVGRNVSMLMPSPDREAHDSYIDYYLRTGHRRIIGIGREALGQRKDGSTFPIHLSVSEATVDGQRVFTGIVHDITRQKQAEDALRALTTRYEAILTSVPDLIVEVDAEKRHVWMNSAAREFYGADAIGKRPDDYFVGDQDTYAQVQPIFDGREDTIYVESWQYRRDGEPRLLAWWCRGLKDAKGNVIGALSTARDVTDRQRNVEEQARLLTELKERNKKITCLYSVGEVIRSSQTDSELFGAVARLIAPACFRPEITRTRITYDGQSYCDSEFQKTAWLTGADIVVGGRVRGRIEVAYLERLDDVDARRYLREDRDLIDAIARTLGETEERRDAEAQVLQASKLASIGELAAGVGHEINNPINGIMNCADIILQSAPPNSRERKYAELIRAEADRIALIVRNLLTFSRQEQEHHSLARLCDIVEAVLSLSRKRIQRSHIDLHVDVPESLPKIRCRNEQIQQVLMNLIINSIHALDERYPEGDPNKRMAIEAHPITIRKKPYLRLTVTDHGVGIHPAHKDRLFDPFFTTKGRDKGTGLGLSVSDGIVKSHGGTISVESELGQYTRFHVDIPLDEATENP